MPEISVIIPAYNAGKTLLRCLRSLQEQSFTGWEAVVVDDGSTDGTSALLDSLAENDSRIRAFHRENGGVSAARNFALRNLSGKYVMFVDSDDFLHPRAMEICISLAERDGSDIVTFTYSHSYRTRLMIRHLLHLKDPSVVKFPSIGADFPSELSHDIFEKATEYSHPRDPLAAKHCQPWRCLYRREILDGIEFIPGIIYEDFPWWSEVLLRVKKATLTALELYYYYPNPGSYILSSKEAFKIESLRRAIAAAQDLYKDVEEERKSLWEREFLTPFKEKLAKKEKRYTRS